MSDILRFGDGGGCKDDDENASPLPLVASIGDGDSLDEEGEGRCVAGCPSSATDATGIRDRVRVGLEARLYDVGLTDVTPKVIGMPSRIPFSSRPSRFGRGKGKLESGPAMF